MTSRKRACCNHATIEYDNVDVVGNHNHVRGRGCTVIGNHNSLVGNGCKAIGNHNSLDGNGCTATGNHNRLVGEECEAVGTYNRVNDTPCNAHADGDDTTSNMVHVVGDGMTTVVNAGIGGVFVSGSGSASVGNICVNGRTWGGGSVQVVHTSSGTTFVSQHGDVHL